jgi:transcription elongation factor GreA
MFKTAHDRLCPARSATVGEVSDRSDRMTPEQHAALEAELAELEGPKRAAAVQAIKTAREFGDLSENFEYHAAKNDQGMLEARIRKLKDRLRSAVIVEHDTDDHVGVGSVVEIEDEHGETMEITISAVGGVSPDSPLGRALVGAAVGDVCEVEAPRGAWRATIRSIRRV